MLTPARLLHLRFAGWLLLVLCGTLLTSCKQSASNQARKLVERYNRVVSDAYRRGDVKSIGTVTGPKEGKRLTGLIRIRSEFNLALDSRLLSLEVTGVEQSEGEMRVRTKERWRYRDVRIGTGQQVGEESLGSCEMLYIFTNLNQAWLVNEIRVTRPAGTVAPPSHPHLTSPSRLPAHDFAASGGKPGSARYCCPGKLLPAVYPCSPPRFVSLWSRTSSPA